MDIDTFKNKCFLAAKNLEINIKEWNELFEKQKKYDKKYIMKHKAFKGNLCSNCNTKLNKEYMFRDYKTGVNHYIYTCICGYKYAVKQYEDCVK